MIDYFRFIKKISFLSLLLITLDASLGIILKKLYFSIDTGIYGHLSYIINKSDEDLVILGSSRAFHHYNSKVIEKITHFRTLNAGYGGQSTVYYSAILKTIIDRHPPKVVVIDMIPYSISKSEDSFDKLSCLLPYYYDHPEIHDYINQKSQFEKLKVFSKLYCFNSTPYYLLKEKVHPNLKIEKGFYPINGTIDSTLFQDLQASIEFEISVRQVGYLNNIICMAKSNNIDIVFVISPVLYSRDIYKNLALYLNQFVDNKSIFLLNYSTSDKFKKYSYFWDPIHLNEVGARNFSTVFSYDLLKLPLIYGSN